MNERAAEILDAYLQALESGTAPDREALLAEHPDLAEWLREALEGLDFVHGAGRGITAPTDPGEPGKALGDYRLIREIGRGGMAVVYEAEQVSLGRRVALKVLPFAAVLDPKQLQRFKNEALAAAHLRHPNIVPVHAVGCERGVHYYAMQFVEGQSLAQAIRDLRSGGTGEGPRSPLSSHGSNRTHAYIRMATALGVEAAEALDYAHQLGIVHRDVKPGNLLVDQGGTLWITDFGLARSSRDVGLTMTGELLGTVRYMSPEQALAKRVPIDHRTDVYSLGATLYEFFTLEPAFPGEDPHHVIQDIAFRDPVAPRRLNPAIPVDLETVVLKAMSKDPATRYATAQEMADDLRRYLEDKPVLARRPSIAARIAKWTRRHRAGVATTLTVLFVGAGALAVGAKREERNTNRALVRAETARAKAEENLDLAYRAVHQFLTVVGIRKLDEAPKLTPEVRELLERALEFYDLYLAERRDALGHVNRSFVLVALGRLDEGVAAAEEALGIDPNLCAAHFARGSALRRLGRFEEALSAVDRSLEIDPGSCEPWVERGVELQALGRPEEALDSLARALEIDPELPAAHNNRGMILELQGRHEEALACFDRAIRRAPSLHAAHRSRSVALAGLGRLPEALRAADRAIALCPDDAWTHLHRGAILDRLGRLDEALAADERAIALDPKLGRAHFNRAVVLTMLGRTEEALATFVHAAGLEPDYAPIYTNLCKLHLEAGRLREALAAIDRAIELAPDEGTAHCNRGVVLRKLGRLDEALAECDRVLAIDAMDPRGHHGRGMVLSSMGRDAEAAEALDRAFRIDPRAAYLRKPEILNAIAWHRAVSTEPGARDAKHAVEVARLGVELAPSEGNLWNTLGVALCGTGAWTEALDALEKSMRLRAGGDAYDWFFVAIAQAGQGERDEARRWYEKAVQWTEANRKGDAELERFRVETAAAIGRE